MESRLLIPHDAETEGHDISVASRRRLHTDNLTDQRICIRRHKPHEVGLAIGTGFPKDVL
jgi:hypothetical protein